MPDESSGPPPAPRVRRAPVWAKLWSAVIIANLAGFLVAVWVARLVRDIPESSGTETALLFGYYATMAIIAFIDALLLDELVFKGAFRRTHIQGRIARFAKQDSDVKDLAVTLQKSTMTFPFLLLVTGAITYNVFNLVNNDFDVYHRRVGKYISALHQADDPAQIEAVRQLSIRREKEVLPALKWRLRQGGEPAAWSAWALGRFTDQPTRRPLWKPLVVAARGDDPMIRREALVALGRLQNRAMAPAIQAEVRAQLDAGEPIDPRLMYALGAVQVMSSVELLEELLYKADETTQRLAAWALAQHRDQRGGREVVKILESRLGTASPLLACAIVHSLGILADERSNLALLKAYDETSVADRSTVCPRLRLSLRPDAAEDDQADLFVPQDALAMKVIMVMAQMRATSADVREQVEPWLVTVVNDPATLPGPREAARSLLKGIQSGRDDTEAPSIEEALGIE